MVYPECPSCRRTLGKGVVSVVFADVCVCGECVLKASRIVREINATNKIGSRVHAEMVGIGSSYRSTAVNVSDEGMLETFGVKLLRAGSL